MPYRRRQEIWASTFLAHLFPAVKAETWDQLPGAYAVTKAMHVPRTAAVTKTVRDRRELLILKLNFNVPNTRDSLKLGSLCSAMATLARQAGPSRSLAWPPLKCSPPSPRVLSFYTQDLSELVLRLHF